MTKRIHIPRDAVMPDGHYVYAVLVDGTIRYIGKGTRWRAWDHTRNSTNCAALRVARWVGSQITVTILAEGISSHADALRQEDAFIDQYKEQLWNVRKVTDAEMTRSMWANPMMRKRIVTAQRSAVGSKMEDEEYRSKIRQTKQQAFRESAAMRAGLEAGRTSEARKKQGRSFAERWRDPEFRAHMMTAFDRRAAARRAWETRRRNLQLSAE